MLVIADTSPLRYLTVIGQPELLPTIFGEIWVPGAVLEGLSATSTPEVVRALFEHGQTWLRTREPADRLLRAITQDLDPGERAALALALELKADLVLIDDSAGRREAVALGIRITGTLGVLRLAAERGMVDVPAMLQRLRESGFYIKESVVRSAFGPWLSE